MATGKSLEFTLSGKKKSAYFIKLAGSELTRILECLRPERCAPGRSKYPFIRDLIELRIGDVDGYVGRLTETGGTIWFEGEPYRRIVCSAGHARGKKVFFLHTAVWDQVMDILACGMDLTQEFSPTKVNAYFGLAASNSVPVAELPRMVVVDDCHRAIEDIFDVVRADVAGYTRERFAEKLDVSVSYLAELERGRTGVSVKTLIAICNLLGLSADYVLFGSERGGDAALLDKLHRIDEKYVPLLDSVLDQLLALNADTTK